MDGVQLMGGIDFSHDGRCHGRYHAECINSSLISILFIMTAVGFISFISVSCAIKVTWFT